MRVTRTKTGKLPTKVARDDVVSDYESPPPSPMSAASATAIEPTPELLQPELIVPMESAPVFQTIKSNNKIESGLAIVRDLGGGRYEIISLKNVDSESFSSKETGVLIKADDARHAAIKLGKDDWEAAAFKCAMAIGSADKTIFRFRKLPIELRYRIYDFAIAGFKVLRRSWNGEQAAKTVGFNLMIASKEIYEETKPFFYKNNFRIGQESKLCSSIPVICRDSLKEVTFEWFGWGRKDRTSWDIIMLSLPNVKILNLRITHWAISHQWPNTLGQQDMQVKKFVQTKGFSEITSVRGLDTVRVINEGPRKAPAHDLSQDELKAFQDYLTEKLTMPKYVPPPPPPAPFKQAAKVTRKTAALLKVKKSKRKNWEDDSDYEG
ncbi:uncharacterized protein L3040_006177 [Drepanopeziza brunnea f. sp. 'multigermtubi']|uniref:uncharacterized protein n=1 Tax=Drepanopeziza brunnea f. sp. 'multigermtubi' TaxID=698441 RepID=UPI0023A3E2EA|nr:hypothetical protein L3040_006177 [Drepanopeziza brunnea f. sp. 'multigermtubi']